ncbi:MAG: transketolase [Candidatus Omnitrophica bacterium]|nr:transketolase [Candidatus Omnitrophota bacterium]
MLKSKKSLKDKADWVRRETIRIHGIAPQTRVASSLSCVEILTALYYGKVLSFDKRGKKSAKRDRLVLSKGHGAVSIYPILADLGFFNPRELRRVCQAGSFLGSIPDTLIPGIETTNGSLGHGLGVSCGISIALRLAKDRHKVFALIGDGELYEGSVWEAVMFAGHHKLSNIIAIVDNNGISMLDYCRRIIDLRPYEQKFRAFGWKAETVDGHDVLALRQCLARLKSDKTRYPKVVIAKTVKGKGVPSLESDALCHIKSLSNNEVSDLLKGADEE